MGEHPPHAIHRGVRAGRDCRSQARAAHHHELTAAAAPRVGVLRALARARSVVRSPRALLKTVKVTSCHPDAERSEVERSAVALLHRKRICFAGIKKAQTHFRDTPNVLNNSV